MWEQYKKSFRATQAVIFLVAAAAYVFSGRQPQQAATLFVFMQFSALVGAVWAARFAGIMQRRAGRPGVRSGRAHA